MVIFAPPLFSAFKVLLQMQRRGFLGREKNMGNIILYVALWIGISCLSPAQALRIDITKGVMRKIPLAFLGIQGGERLEKVAKDDLENASIFTMIPSGTQSKQAAFVRPELWQWEGYDGAVMATGILTQDGEDLLVKIRLYDVMTKKILGEATIKGTQPKWRHLAHKIADAIYERLTGETGYFNTQIFYIDQYGPASKKTRRLAVMDQDGANHRYLTPDSYMALTPQCSPNGSLVTFSALHGYASRLHLLDLASGRNAVLPIQGITVSPRFSPDGSHLIYCLAKQGTTSVRSYTLASGEDRQLTRSEGKIDVSPSYSPDGKQLVFASDRVGGKSKLYAMTLSTGAIKRLGSGEGSYFCPVWSPNGKWIAFVRSYGGTYYIGVMAADGSGERMLAADHVIDTPSWAPNSQLLLFAAQQKRFGPFCLFRVDVAGHVLKKLPTPHEGNHPYWRPLSGENEIN